MSASTTIPVTIEMRRGSLASLLVAAAVFAGAVAWAITAAVTGDSNINTGALRSTTTAEVSTPQPDPSDFVAQVTAATPEEVAAAYGNVPLTPVPDTGDYLAQLAKATPEELAAAFGNTWPWPSASPQASATEPGDGIRLPGGP